LLPSTYLPRLAPWAAIYRRFAAEIPGRRFAAEIAVFAPLFEVASGCDTVSGGPGFRNPPLRSALNFVTGLSRKEILV
jgi:hypothetical protein